MGNNKLRVCAYVRVSTGSKEQKNSFENQKSYFERELNKDEYEFIGMYADEGITGTSLKKRDGFNDMIRDAGIDVDNHRGEYVYVVTDRQPKFDMIFVKNTSRLARNILVWDVVQKLKRKGVYIHFLDLNKNTKEMEDEVILKIISVLDENESRDKSLKVKSGMQESARKGKLYTNGKLYGYNYIKDENRFEIIEEEAKVIRLIFELYSQDNGIHVIEKYLQKNNFKHNRTGEDFNKASINNILKNMKYAGINASMIWDTGEVFNKKYARLRSKDEWISKKDYDKIPPIISEELYNKCQEMRSGKVNTQLQKGINKGHNFYTRYLICSKCGANYNINTQRGEQFYNCRTKKSDGVSKCNNINVKLKTIEEEVIRMCNGGYKENFRLLSDYNAFILNKYKERIYARIDQDTKKEVDELFEEYNKTKLGLERLLDLYQDLDLDKETYLERSEKLNDKLMVLEYKIEGKNKTNAELFNDISVIDEAIEQLKNINIKDKYTKEELFDEISHIEVSRKQDENGNEIERPYLFFVFKWMQSYKEIIRKYGSINY